MKRGCLVGSEAPTLGEVGTPKRTRFLVSTTIEVEAAHGDHAAAALAAQALWDADGIEGHNARAEHHACLEIKIIEHIGGAGT